MLKRLSDLNKKINNWIDKQKWFIRWPVIGLLIIIYVYLIKWLLLLAIVMLFVKK